MNVQIELFAAAREAVGDDTAEVALPDGATVGELRRALAAQFPALASIIPYVKFAIDLAYADDRTVLPRGAIVAAIPPVSGG
jgi:molybdopterin converting factor subunit 1